MLCFTFLRRKLPSTFLRRDCTHGSASLHRTNLNVKMHVHCQAKRDSAVLRTAMTSWTEPGWLSCSYASAWPSSAVATAAHKHPRVANADCWVRGGKGLGGWVAASRGLIQRTGVSPLLEQAHDADARLSIAFDEEHTYAL